MSHAIIGSITLSLLTLGIAAQSAKTIPTGLANKDGDTSSPYFSGYGGGRAQQVVEGWALATNAGVISDVRLRADKQPATMAMRTFPKLTLSLGYTSVTAASMSTTFAANRTGKQTQVFSGKYSLPPQFANIRPFSIAWKLAAPFPYINKSGNLLVEWEVANPPAKGNYFLDSHFGADSGSVGVFGQHGTLKGQTWRVTGDAITLRLGGKATFTAQGFNKSFPAVAMWGSSRSRYSTLKLPFSLTTFGAPGNALNVSPDIIVPMQIRSAPPVFLGQSQAPIANNPYFAGKTVYVQAVVVDAASNSLGRVFSSGVSMTIASGRNPMQLIGDWDYNKAVGRKARGGLVIQFGGSFN